MRRNNRRRINLNENSRANKMVIISLFVLIISILAFYVTFVIYRNYLNSKTDISEIKYLDVSSLDEDNNSDSSEASSSIGKTVNEAKEDEKSIYSNTEKIAINTSNMEKESIANLDSNLQTETVAENKQETNTNVKREDEVIKEEIKKEEIKPDPTFKKPVEGEIIAEFAKDTLIYSNTLQEWVTHNGIDIKADKTTIVKAATDGTVKSIKNDPRYGITVVIEHVNGYTTVYSNLLTAEFIKEDEKVAQGQTIGTVGNTATFEIADAPHLHFEILKDDEYVDPNLYLK